MGFLNSGADSAGRVFGSRVRKRKDNDTVTSSSRYCRSGTASTSSSSAYASSRASTPSTMSSFSSTASGSKNTPKCRRTRLPPPPKPLSRLEALPTELIHRILLMTGPNPALADASLQLTYCLSSRHLQSRYLTANPTDALTRRFVTPELLIKYPHIDLDGAVIPLGMLKPEERRLLGIVVERGARCDEELMDAYREAAVECRDAEIVRALVKAGFRGDARCLEFAVEEGERDAFADLLDKAEEEEGGGPAGLLDVGVWRAALRQQDEWFLEIMVTITAPPGEMLGEVLGRQRR